jgi:hypothetical protein
MTDEIVIGGDSVDIPPSTYPAVLTGIVTKHSTKYDNDFRVWTFRLDNGSVVDGSSSMNTGRKSKGGKWIAALLGRQPEKGEKVAKELFGKHCFVVVDDNDDGWPEVIDVFPLVASTSAPAPAESPPSQPVAVGQTQISEELPF